MTLESAYAAYAIERDGILDELHPYAGDYPDTSISWHRERDRLALDDAVKDAMLAVAGYFGHRSAEPVNADNVEYPFIKDASDPNHDPHCPYCEVVAEIERLFEEGGKE